jgi:hypothetical protein
MRTQSLTTLLHSEAKRKPELAALIDRVQDLTEEEIDAAPGLPWVKKALREMRGPFGGEDNYNLALARILPHIRNGVVPDGEGTLSQWVTDGWATIDRNNQLLMTPGALVWFPDTGGCWIGSIFTHTITSAFLNNTRLMRRCTKSDYALAQRDRIIAQNPELKIAATLDPDDRGLFRIIRH